MTRQGKYQKYMGQDTVSDMITNDTHCTCTMMKSTWDTVHDMITSDKTGYIMKSTWDRTEYMT